MATEILRPQDCLGQRIRVPPCRRRNYYDGQNHNHSYNHPSSYSNSNPNQAFRYYENSNNRINRKPAVRSERIDKRRRQSEPNKRSSPSDDLKFSKNHQNHHGGRGARENLTMDKVSILRRGESLDSKMKSMELAATARKQVRKADFGSPAKTDMYAGSAFSVSPAPSSLPLPSFFKKKQLAVDDSATRDLRRLLRLEL